MLVGAEARVGSRATLLPGASLGDRSVLGDDSVLSRRVPADVVIAGVPARLVGGRYGSEQRPPTVDGSTAAIRPHAWPLAIAANELATVGKPTIVWLSARDRASRVRGRALPVIKKIERVVTLASAHYQLRSADRIRRAFVCGRMDVINTGRLANRG